MNKKKQNMEQSYNQVKSHYERAAESRNERLLTSGFNAAKVNHEERLKIIKSFLKQIGTVKQGVDIGTGTGVWSEVMLDYCENITGIDFAKQNIKIASEKAANRNISYRLSYIEGDAERLNGVSENFFDVATHVSVLQHLPDQMKALERVNDILKKDGQIIILVHNRHCIYNRSLNQQNRRGTTVAINKYNSLEEIVDLLEKAGFQIKRIRLSWFFFLDFLLIGLGRSSLAPFEPFRRALLVVFCKIGGWLGRFQSLSPFFREIVIQAIKR